MLTLALPAVAEAAPGGTSGAQQATATTYWSFDNMMRGCLTGGDGGAAFETACNGGSEHQDWYWTGLNHDMLANRATGKCLVTDINSGTDHANAVWTTSSCYEGNRGQHWTFDYDSGYLRSALATYLRTSPTEPNAVYADNSWIDDRYYRWSASHN
ncbi:hypothetical protein ACZ90_31880 [Streptomyces albus subsp. albus]|nr:hypothetical protein ACZ90_31880 [Streptomyces albus subsp. albus]